MPNFVSRLKRFVDMLDKDVFVLYPKVLRLWDFEWMGSLKNTISKCKVSDWLKTNNYDVNHLLYEFDDDIVRFDYYYGQEGLHIMPKKLAKAISFNEELGYRQDPKVEFQALIKKCGIDRLYEIKLYLFHIEHGESLGERKFDKVSKEYIEEKRRDNKEEEIKEVIERIKGVYPNPK